MSKFHISLRVKFTAIVTGVMAVCCFFLTAVSLSTSSQMVEALPLSQTMRSFQTYPADILPSTDIDDPTCEPARITSIAQTTFRTQNLVAMLLVITTGSVIAYCLVKHQLSPLEKLASMVENLDIEHMHQVDIPLSATQDESFQLSLAINKMAHRVGRAYQMQKDFAASAAHELRTPLAAIQSRLEVFLLKQRTPEEYQRLLEQIGHNVSRLNTLVEQLLQLCSTQLEASEKSVDMLSIAKDVEKELTSSSIQAGMQIEIFGSAFADGNARLFHQIIFNLVQNSIKYGQTGGHVHITLSNTNNSTVIKIEDDGPGIPSTAREHIFDAFYRVDHSRHRQIGGNGLGLAIVQRIVQQYNGSIVLEDSSMGGACFTVTLPYKISS